MSSTSAAWSAGSIPAHGCAPSRGSPGGARRRSTRRSGNRASSANAELGEIDPVTLRSLLLAALEANIDAETLRAGWSLAFDPDDEVLALIDRLAVPAVLFTNNGPMVDSCLDHELFRVRGRFAHVFLSWELGAAKPEPAAYTAVTTKLEVEGSQLFFVDDSPENVAAARALGWQAEVFTDAATLEQQLAVLDVFQSA